MSDTDSLKRHARREATGATWLLARADLDLAQAVEIYASLKRALAHVEDLIESLQEE